VPKGEGRGFDTVERTDPLVAPLTQGQNRGHAEGHHSGRLAGGQRPLTVLEPVPLAGVFGRAWDAVRLWIK
jgi:serine-type D-Ala-D-Ala carboxypeptidase (penicillin-binding protein 5/6)